MSTDAFFDTAIFDDSLFDTYAGMYPDIVFPTSIDVTYDLEVTSTITADEENTATITTDEENVSTVTVSE